MRPRTPAIWRVASQAGRITRNPPVDSAHRPAALPSGQRSPESAVPVPASTASEGLRLRSGRGSLRSELRDSGGDPHEPTRKAGGARYASTTSARLTPESFSRAGGTKYRVPFVRPLVETNPISGRRPGQAATASAFGVSNVSANSRAVKPSVCASAPSVMRSRWVRWNRASASAISAVPPSGWPVAGRPEGYLWYPRREKQPCQLPHKSKRSSVAMPRATRNGSIRLPYRWRQKQPVRATAALRRSCVKSSTARDRMRPDRTRNNVLVRYPWFNLAAS